MDKKKKRSVVRGVILTILVAAIAYTVYMTATQDKVKRIQEGDQAPNFELVDLDGETHRLSDYKGQGVFLNFWGTWCKPCEREMPAMNRQYTVYKDLGVQTLAVNVGQSDFEVERFISSMNLKFPVMIDKSKDVLTPYGKEQLPITILINPEGEVTKIVKGEMTEQHIQAFMESIQPEQGGSM